MSKYFIKNNLVTLLGYSFLSAFFAIICPALPAQAIGFGRYKIHNHSDGNAAPPPYGLRLDGLLSGDTNDIYTFNFDHKKSNLFLEYNKHGIKIHGTVFGGQDKGKRGYVNSTKSRWKLKFNYTNVTKNGDGLIVNSHPYQIGTPDNGLGFGRISSKKFGTFNLVGFSGKYDHTFQIGKNHRGESGYSGWGWLNHSGAEEHLKASDWLFTLKKHEAEPVPEPLTILGSALALGFGGFFKKEYAKRQKAKV